MSIEILTTTEKVNKIKEARDALADNLSAMGVNASAEEGLEKLVPKVLDCAIYGTYTFKEDVTTFALTDLPFEPTGFAMWNVDANYMSHGIVAKKIMGSIFINKGNSVKSGIYNQITVEDGGNTTRSVGSIKLNSTLNKLDGNAVTLDFGNSGPVLPAGYTYNYVIY